MTEMILCNSLQASGSHSPSALFPDNQLILVLNFQFKPEPDVFLHFWAKKFARNKTSLPTVSNTRAKLMSTLILFHFRIVLPKRVERLVSPR